MDKELYNITLFPLRIMQHISKINKYELRAENKGEQIPTQFFLDGPRLGVVCEAISGEGLREVTLAYLSD